MAAERLVDLAERKIELKDAYYSKKLKIMQEQSDTLKNINKLLLNFVSDKTNKL